LDYAFNSQSSANIIFIPSSSLIGDSSIVRMILG